MSAVNSTNEILLDFTPFLIQYKDGRIVKLMGQDFAPALVDPETGVQSKDVVISPETNLSARIFLPKTATPERKFPLLVFYHGGGFVVESAFSPTYTRHLNFLVAEANVVAVSVNYRLLPEYPLPIAYEDSWLALKWVVSQFKIENSNADEWIRHFADPARVYLGGDSAGGNIAHNMGIRVGLEKLEGSNLCGIFLNCPYFWGGDRIGNEEAYYKMPMNFYADDLWRYACPLTSGCDDPLINPATDPNLSGLGCKRVLVYVAEKDFLRDRGLYYKEALKKSDWDGEVEVVDAEEEGHVFSVLNPNCENGMAMFKKVADFLNK